MHTPTHADSFSDPEIVFIFSVDSSRVDAISGLLCSLGAPRTGLSVKKSEKLFFDSEISGVSENTCFSI
jgi:hypothetical protein